MKRKILGNLERPRISVFRSNKNIYVQIIDDFSGKTLVSFSSNNINNKNFKTKTEKSYELGKIIGMKIQKLKINKLIFDKKKYLYHGRVKSLADGMRKVGLKF